MNKSFILLDKNNNLQKKANIIVKFNFVGVDYLVYSVEESEQNDQIFVSKLVLNSEGKYFIDNILPEEKSKLNNIVYNIVILIPTEVQKGNSFENLSNNLVNKFSAKLVSGLPDMDAQEYFSNCSVAITSKVLVDAAIKLYYENLNDDSNSDNLLVPTWTAPSEVTAPVEVNANDVKTDSVAVSTIPVQEPVVIPNLNLQAEPINETVVTSGDGNVNSSSITSSVGTEKIVSDSEINSNPQIKKLAIVSDPSLVSAGLSVQQPNVGKLKKAGFANTKYIVIGTICLVLAVLIVIVSYILIKNMK